MGYIVAMIITESINFLYRSYHFSIHKSLRVKEAGLSRTKSQKKKKGINKRSKRELARKNGSSREEYIFFALVIRYVILKIFNFSRNIL